MEEARPKRAEYPELRVTKVIYQPDQAAIARAVIKLTDWWVLQRANERAEPRQDRSSD